MLPTIIIIAAVIITASLFALLKRNSSKAAIIKERQLLRKSQLEMQALSRRLRLREIRATHDLKKTALPGMLQSTLHMHLDDIDTQEKLYTKALRLLTERRSQLRDVQHIVQTASKYGRITLNRTQQYGCSQAFAQFIQALKDSDMPLLDERFANLKNQCRQDMLVDRKAIQQILLHLPKQHRQQTWKSTTAFSEASALHHAQQIA